MKHLKKFEEEYYTDAEYDEMQRKEIDKYVGNNKKDINQIKKHNNKKYKNGQKFLIRFYMDLVNIIEEYNNIYREKLIDDIIKLIKNNKKHINQKDSIWNGATVLHHITSDYYDYLFPILKLCIDLGVDWNISVDFYTFIDLLSRDYLYVVDKIEKLYPDKFEKYLKIKNAEKYNIL